MWRLMVPDRGAGDSYNLSIHAEYDALLTDLLDACRRHYGDWLVVVAVYGSVRRWAVGDGRLRAWRALVGDPCLSRGPLCCIQKKVLFAIFIFVKV